MAKRVFVRKYVGRKIFFLSEALHKIIHKISIKKYDCDSLEQLIDRLLFQNNWIVDTRIKIDEYNECADDAVMWIGNR